MKQKLIMFVIAVLAFASLALAGLKSWTGTVSDDMCGAIQHDRACIEKCVAAGGHYILVVSKDKTYRLNPQNKFAGLGGKHVKVTGTLEGDTISVTSVRAR